MKPKERKLKQVDLFLNPIPLCPFCGYPMLPMVNWRCEHEMAMALLGDDYSTFRVFWHTDLEEEARFHKKFGSQIAGRVAEFYDANPEIVERVNEIRLESWVEDHGPNQGQLERDFQRYLKTMERYHRHGGRYVPKSQVSLIGYIFGGSPKEAE